MAVAEMIAVTLATEAAKFIFAKLSAKNWNGTTTEINIEEALKYHFTWLDNWTFQSQFFEFAQIKPTEKSTIALKFDTVPRKFLSTGVYPDVIGERILLSDNTNYLILGAPGAGKTTTLKRLSRQLLLTNQQNAQDFWGYPLFIRLRDIDESSGILTRLADIVGLQYEPRKGTDLVKRKVQKYEVNPQNMRVLRELKDDTVLVEETVLITKIYSGGIELLRAVADVLNAGRAIIFFDGLDEVHPSRRLGIEEEIQQLLFSLSSSKIIVTCRTGDYRPTEQIEGMAVIELCPLDQKQQKSLVRRWLKEPAGFFKTLSRTPYADVADRPLLLTQLIVFYYHNHRFPEQHTEMYERTLNLLLEEWNRQAKLPRPSRYSGFDATRKRRFLSAIAYHLTYKVKKKSFDTRLLEEAYTEVCGLFRLPPDEAPLVAREIETHNGIIGESNTGKFEFSHLSLQEFLCAEYLVREPFADHFTDYLREYPAPVAIAVAISAHPSNWFANVILHKTRYRKIDRQALTSMLSRLCDESPSFTFSHLLGHALFELLVYYHKDIGIEHVQRLCSSEDSRLSLAYALSWYNIDLKNSSDQNYNLIKRSLLVTEFDFYQTEGGKISRELIDYLVKTTPLQLEIRGDTGVLVHPRPK